MTLMTMGFLTRRVVTGLLTANAVKPGLGYAGPQASVFGWRISDMLGWAAGLPTSELAPQLLAATAVDTAQAVVRGTASKPALALTAVSAAGLGYVISQAHRTKGLAHDALRESLGEGYRNELSPRPADADLVSSWAEWARPFRIRQPDIEVIRNVNYRPGQRRARLDIYRPKGVDLTNAPVLLQIHGGSWSMGNKSYQGLPLLNQMAHRGWVCVTINYRLAPRDPFPAQIIDVKKAIAWIRENIHTYGGDPAYVVTTGNSAGGHLAALAALTPGLKEFQPGFEDADTSVSACVPLYGMHDLAGITGDRRTVEHVAGHISPNVLQLDFATHRQAFELASALTHVTPDAPDFFVLHGAKDTLVDVTQGRALATRLREMSKGIVTYLELPLGQHGFDAIGTIRSRHAVRAVETWLEWHRANRREATPVANPQRSLNLSVGPVSM